MIITDRRFTGTLSSSLRQGRTVHPGHIPMADTEGFTLYTDGRMFYTARRLHGELLDVHTHAHRDAAVDDFHARAGLIKEARR